jgi:hypothetical protein
LFLLSLSGNISDLGCTDPTACNYDPDAIEDNGLCAENDVCGLCGGDGTSCSGCADNVACNYDPSATIDDGSCIIGGVEITFTILTDNYPGETTWSIADANGLVVMTGGPYSSSATTYSSTVCVDNGCYDLTINDSFGDGICCGYGTGNYEITSQGQTLFSGGEFGLYETVNFCISGGEPDVPGCTNYTACNYDATATLDDGSCEYTSCVCQGDVNGDGAITVADILIILSEFGCTIGCSADVDGDGSVTVSDVLVVLSIFGNPC